MTAKEYLKQIRRADIVIGHKLDELAMLKEAIRSVKAIDYSKDKVSSSPSDNYSKVDRYIDLNKEINNRIDELVSLRERIIEQIDELDTVYSDILFRRYVKYQSLERMAVELNYSYEYVKHLHGFALLDFERRHLKADGGSNGNT